MKFTNFARFFLLSAALGNSMLFSQAGNNSGSRLVSVQVLQAIDSTKAASGTQFTGKIVNAVTTPQGTTLQAGAAAVMTLVQQGNTWTLNLVSPVSGTYASVGGAVGAVTGQLNNQLGGLVPGIGSFGRKKNNNAGQNQTSDSVTGARILITANSQVRFLMAGAANQAAAPAQVTQTPVQAPTAPVASAVPAGVQAQGVLPSQPGAPAAPAAAPVGNVNPTAQPAGANTVTWGNVQYVLQGCQRQAPHISCQVQVTNLNAGDANLLTNRNTYFVDQSGNRVALNAATLANCNLMGGCLALSGLPMSASFDFIDEDSKSLTLVRLQIVTRAGPVQFTNVSVK